MITIGICDDNIDFAFKLERLIDQYFDASGVEYKVEIFSSGMAFLDHSDAGTVDILFLDILLGSESGIDIGAEMRNREGLEETLIIYVSTIEKYTKELIRTRPTEYLAKPIEFTKLKTVLDDCLRRLNKRDDSISVSYKRDKHKIRISDIVYIESKARICEIVTARGTVMCYAKLADVGQQIGDSGFIQIHKSYIVNFKYVSYYNYEEIILFDGKKLTISQSRRKIVRSKYMLYAKGDTK